MTRARRDARFRRQYSQPVDRSGGLICDQHVELNSFYPRKAYPQRLRRIRFKDADTGKTFVFLTNHFGLPALSICALYKSRWQVELFFKWIKQHLRINRFFGTSPNAVKSQVWIAVAAYVLIAIVRKKLNLDLSLHAVLQILSISPFENIPISELFSRAPDTNESPGADNQLILL